MAELNVDLNRYCREVKKWLPDNGLKKRRILRGIRNQVEQFQKDHPDADYAAITARFGEPQHIAASALDEMDCTAVLKSLNIRNRIVKAVAAAVAVAAFAWCAFLVYAVINTEIGENEPGYVVVTVVEATPPSKEELNWLYGGDLQ